MASKIEPFSVGHVLGRLTVTGLPEPVGRYLYVPVRCQCGTVKKVEQGNLRRVVRSCGCWSRELAAKLNLTHGMRSKPVYAVWNAMQARILNPANRQYKDYGGRGLKLEPDWKTFEGFYRDMGEPPFEGATLKRVDNDKGYLRGNVIWASRTAQVRNRKATKFVTYQGETKSLPDWCDRLKLDYRRVYQRLHTYKWSVDDAFTK